MLGESGGDRTGSPCGGAPAAACVGATTRLLDGDTAGEAGRRAGAAGGEGAIAAGAGGTAGGEMALALAVCAELDSDSTSDGAELACDTTLLKSSCLSRSVIMMMISEGGLGAPHLLLL